VCLMRPEEKGKVDRAYERAAVKGKGTEWGWETEVDCTGGCCDGGVGGGFSDHVGDVPYSGESCPCAFDRSA
jgi:hypothetical protein